MMEAKKILLLSIALIAVGFIVALIVFNTSNSVSNSNQMAMHEQYPGLPEQNRFITEPSDQIIDRFKNGTGVIFLGFKECPWCQKTAPLLNKAAEAEDVSVYYLDIRQERENQTPAYKEIISILAPFLPKDEKGKVTITTPDISFVKNGKVIWRHEMESTGEAELTPETYWTGARQERAIAQFRENIQALK